VQYNEIGAYLVLATVDDHAAGRACTILKRIREPARNTQFAQGVEALRISRCLSRLNRRLIGPGNRVSYGRASVP